MYSNNEDLIMRMTFYVILFSFHSDIIFFYGRNYETETFLTKAKLICHTILISEAMSNLYLEMCYGYQENVHSYDVPGNKHFDKKEVPWCTDFLENLH